MAQFYYIINSSSYSDVENDLDCLVHWNISGSQCIIEVAVGYNPSFYSKKFRTSNECQDYINDPIRIDEWYQPDESEMS
jgi:hypothetical protein